MIERRKSRVVTAGNVKIGGDNAKIALETLITKILKITAGGVK